MTTDHQHESKQRPEIKKQGLFAKLMKDSVSAFISGGMITSLNNKDGLESDKDQDTSSWSADSSSLSESAHEDEVAATLEERRLKGRKGRRRVNRSRHPKLARSSTNGDHSGPPRSRPTLERAASGTQLLRSRQLDSETPRTRRRSLSNTGRVQPSDKVPSPLELGYGDIENERRSKARKSRSNRDRTKHGEPLKEKQRHQGSSSAGSGARRQNRGPVSRKNKEDHTKSPRNRPPKSSRSPQHRSRHESKHSESSAPQTSVSKTAGSHQENGKHGNADCFHKRAPSSVAMIPEAEDESHPNGEGRFEDKSQKLSARQNTSRRDMTVRSQSASSILAKRVDQDRILPDPYQFHSHPPGGDARHDLLVRSKSAHSVRGPSSKKDRQPSKGDASRNDLLVRSKSARSVERVSSTKDSRPSKAAASRRDQLLRSQTTQVSRSVRNLYLSYTKEIQPSEGAESRRDCLVRSQNTRCTQSEGKESNKHAFKSTNSCNDDVPPHPTRSQNSHLEPESHQVQLSSSQFPITAPTSAASNPDIASDIDSVHDDTRMNETDEMDQEFESISVFDSMASSSAFSAVPSIPSIPVDPPSTGCPEFLNNESYCLRDTPYTDSTCSEANYGDDSRFLNHQAFGEQQLSDRSCKDVVSPGPSEQECQDIENALSSWMCSCGQEVSLRFPFCGACGSHRDEDKNCVLECSVCGFEDNKANFNFCGCCGCCILKSSNGGIKLINLDTEQESGIGGYKDPAEQIYQANVAA